MEQVVVIGAGQAGASLISRLRSQGYTGRIVLIGAEDSLPYQRPPLSKAYMLGKMERHRLLLRPPAYYEEHGIEVMTGTRAAGIDPRAHRIRLQDGRDIAYDRLALTTGSVPRMLPEAMGGRLPGVYALRDLRDADALRGELRPGARVVIVGGGYIGLEAAAVMAQSGLQVRLLEAESRILARVAAPQTSAWFSELHRRHGVEIICGAAITRLVEREGRVAGAELADGTVLEADFVVIGIGIRPETALAESAGLAIENGIRLDTACRSSDPDIFAAGDCASFPWRGRRIRLESVQNAIDQGEAAADAMLGRPVEYAPVPWFWSDQYDVKLQIAGLNAGYDRIVTRQGSREGAISFWYYAG
ncbi:MAG: pyridine nucleotide-disulfide oxidoreductase, partial [Alphaproteobacteria bacterium]